MTVDGNAAALVDLSAVGAQVVLADRAQAQSARPRLLLLGGTKAAIRCNGGVAWASFEMPKGLPPRYRAGVEF